MNTPHQGARLTVHSREQIVARLLAGQSAAKVAEDFAVSVRKRLARSPARLADATVEATAYPRRTFRMTAGAIAARLRLARSTVDGRKMAGGRDLGKLSRTDPPEPVRRYQRDRPGEPVHIDIEKLGRCDRPGHRVTGVRTGCRNRGAADDRQRIGLPVAALRCRTRRAVDPAHPNPALRPEDQWQGRVGHANPDPEAGLRGAPSDLGIAERRPAAPA